MNILLSQEGYSEREIEQNFAAEYAKRLTDALEEKHDDDKQTLEAEINSVASELTAGLSNAASELEAGLSGVRSELETELYDDKVYLERSIDSVSSTVDANFLMYLSSMDELNNGLRDGTAIGEGAVTSEKIGSGAVTAAKIVSGAVTTEKIADGAVTAAKISSGAVTSEKLDSSAKPSFTVDSNGDLTSSLYSGMSFDSTSIASFFSLPFVDANAREDIDDLQNAVYNYNTTPQRIGRWMSNGKSVWRMAIVDYFYNMNEIDYDAMLSDGIYSIALPVISGADLIILNSQCILSDDIEHPNIVDDIFLTRENNYNGLSFLLPSGYNKTFLNLNNEGIIGFVEFVASDNAIIS